MPMLETYKKQAKQLLRWHRDRNYSVGGRIRQLPRYRDVTDHESLALNFKLTEAQEIIALEAGYDSWAALRAAVEDAAPQAAAEFYRDRLGFRVDFLHGHPPVYGSVSRDDATLHLRFVHQPVLAADIAPGWHGLRRARLGRQHSRLRRLNESRKPSRLADTGIAATRRSRR